MTTQVSDIGISVVYEPDRGDPIVDIVLVHGLHGHPHRSWTAPRPPGESQPSAVGVDTSNQDDGGGKTFVHRLATRMGNRKSQQPPKVFWPVELLPRDCPNARILVFGYDSKVTKYGKQPANENGLFAHGPDLLYNLCRERRSKRPIIFIVHHLGGTVVKEALARSFIENEGDLRDVVESTAAIVFMGTPHRGSPDLAALGEFLRRSTSMFRMKTSPAILDALRLRSDDLARAQTSFSALWRKYDFRVKTFKEGLGFSGWNLGVLGSKVVPDYSSTIGDHRERAETLQASHQDMCRFTGFNDPNYKKVSGELRMMYRSIEELGGLRRHVGGRRLEQPASSSRAGTSNPQKGAREAECCRRCASRVGRSKTFASC